jgi:ribosomal protein L37AE/L43A
MKISERPSTWICKSTNKKTGLFSVSYTSLIQHKAAGFSLVDVDPRKYSSPSETRNNIKVPDALAGFLTGRSFGQQAWDICYSAKPGDRIFLECHDADKKPKGKHSTFIVAAGIITGPFKHSPKDDEVFGILSTGVDWQWFGKELIDYGHYMFCFIGIKPTTPSNVRLLEKLDRIWTTRPGTSPDPSSEAIIKADPRSSIEFDPDWREGDAKMRQHLTIERCSKAAIAAKNLARGKTGVITCEACRIAPAKVYGYELIDAHHIVPLADTKGMSRKPSENDFAMLCPTCHRAVHKELRGGAKGKKAIELIRRQFRKPTHKA